MDNHSLPIEEHFQNLLAHQGITEEITGQLDKIYRPIADWIAQQSQPFVVGISGAQGSGKSTLGQILTLLLNQQHQLNVATLSIDDLYKSHSDRQQMAKEIHPLFATRGVPGTHDVALGYKTIQSLKTNTQTQIPRFNKAADEPLPPSEWPIFQGAADVVIFEGWCVGATAQHEDALSNPVNIIEKMEDSDGVWRSHINQQLKHHYPTLFDLIDAQIMLQIPEYEKVLEWRTLQESKLSHQNREHHIMSRDELKRFVMHFERLTRFMLSEMPARADIMLPLNHQHQIDKIEFI